MIKGTVAIGKLPLVTQAEAEAGTDESPKIWTPARVKQAIDALSSASDAVQSVNTKTGAVVLDPDDLDDTATTNKFTTAGDISKLAGIESAATADQTNAEIETAYNAQVAAASQAEAEAGTETAIRRFSPLRVKQAIDALAGGGGYPAHYSTMFEGGAATYWKKASGGTGGSGAVTDQAGEGMRASTGTTSGSFCACPNPGSAGFLTGDGGFVWLGQFFQLANDWEFFMGPGNALVDGTTVYYNSHHYGFKVVNSAGTYTLSATNGNGTTTVTSLGTVNSSAFLRLAAIRTGNSIEFFKDGSSVATHTTNMPTLVTAYSPFNINCSNKSTTGGVIVSSRLLHLFGQL